MATALDPRIEAVRVQYGLQHGDFWELPQKRGTWVAKHAALEVAAAKAGIVFAMPLVLEADGPNKSAALCVSGTLKDRSEWSIGEASPANNKNAYPYAMAEKRGKDRVILKLIGLHGVAYSEDEADDFKQPSEAAHSQPITPTYTTEQPRKGQFDDQDGQSQNWIDQQKRNLNQMTTLSEIQDWVEANEGQLKRLKAKNLQGWNSLRLHKDDRIEQIRKEAA